MKKDYSGMRPATWLMPVAGIPLLAASTMALAQGGRYQGDEAWTFGVTADTQWTITHSLEWEADDSYYAHVNPNYREENPNYVSVSTALKLNEQFIQHGVRFVVQLGDLTDRAGDAAMYTHAEARQPLYDAGIGFFPVRGNHETYGELYGLDPEANVNIPAWRDAFPQTQGGGTNLFGAVNFDGPDNDALTGLSYSFDYGAPGSDARFVFVDIEPTHYELVEPEPHPVYGMGMDYLGWVIYQHSEDVFDSAGNVYPAGSWFRISSSGEPSTNFRFFEMEDFPPEEWAEPLEPSLVAEGDYRPGDQQEWVDERLLDAERPEHAFVLTHRNLMGQNHVDTVWGSSPGTSPDAQNTFYQSLQQSKVGYFLSAHDHMHHRSIVRSPDGNWSIEQLIASSSDPKFYTPATGPEVEAHRWRETPISQELNNIGYYIFTVDGGRVTVDYYADQLGNFGTDYCWPDGYAGDGTCGDPRFSDEPERIGSLYVPNFLFEHKETWGYGLNGKRFIVPQGISYAGEVIVDGDEVTEYPAVSDRFKRTSARILDGVNGSDATDNIPEAPRPLSKTVTTGWVENPDSEVLKSDVLSLWGMAELETDETDVYVLSMSFDFKRMNQLGKGAVGIATYVDGEWVNAVDENFGGTKKFVNGPYVEGRYELGTYGVDPKTKTAWAVLNYNADFAVAGGVEPPPKQPHPVQAALVAVLKVVHTIVSFLFNLRW